MVTLLSRDGDGANLNTRIPIVIVYSTTLGCTVTELCFRQGSAVGKQDSAGRFLTGCELCMLLFLWG